MQTQQTRPEETKECKSCHKELPVSSYYKMERGGDGLHYYCKECCKLRRSVERLKQRDKKSKISNRQRYRSEQMDRETDSDITLAAVFKRDKGICKKCGKPVKVKEASIDHKHPMSKGGTHTWNNVQLMHVSCNKSKGAKT